jgi:hypothetical protein
VIVNVHERRLPASPAGRLASPRGVAYGRARPAVTRPRKGFGETRDHDTPRPARPAAPDSGCGPWTDESVW